MRVYIMYEVSGAMGHVDAKTDDNPETRRAVTQEVNAAIEGASAAGATEFVVNTGCPWSHVLLEELDPRADLIKGGWKPDQTMQGLDESFDAQLVLSMHAKVGTPNAVFAHSWSLAIRDFRVNGQSIGELGMATYYASACGVPTLMVSGDVATCAEARALIPGVEVAPTKESISWISATSKWLRRRRASAGSRRGARTRRRSLKASGTPHGARSSARTRYRCPRSTHP
jgi:D-amino peptidase